MIFYTNLFIPARFAAATYGPFIFIRPEKRDDAGLLAHEQTHVRQFWKNPLFGIAYLLSKNSRAKYEVDAYREQLKHYPEREAVLAEQLATKYGLGISVDDALEMLRNA
jgi:hypothetical protein